MRVQIMRRYKYAIDRVNVQVAEPPDVIDLPDHMARSCIASRFGIKAGDKETKVLPPVETPEDKPASDPVETQADAPVETGDLEPQEVKADDDIVIDDLTELTAIGEANEKALNGVGIYNYHDLMHFISTEEGRAFLVALPRVQPKHIRVLEDELTARL